MQFDVSNLIAGLVFGVVGFWLVKEARRRADFPLFFTGIALLIYPYFVEGWLLSWGIGFALCIVAYYFWP